MSTYVREPKTPDFAAEKALNAGIGTKIAVALGLLVVLTASFFATYGAVMSQPSCYDPSLPWDRLIALKSGWVWIYLLYYPFCFAPLFSREILKDMRLFLRLAGGFLLQFALALPVFYFFPTRIVHPAVVGSGLSAVVLRGLYAVDGGYCVFPSLHVANTAYVALVGRRLFSRPAAAALFLLFALIAASVLLVKQHFILDIPGGILLGSFAYWVFAW